MQFILWISISILFLSFYSGKLIEIKKQVYRTSTFKDPSLEIEYFGSCNDFKSDVIFTVKISKYKECLPIKVEQSNQDFDDLDSYWFCTKFKEDISKIHFDVVDENNVDQTDFVFSLISETPFKILTKNTSLLKKPSCMITPDFCNDYNSFVKKCKTSEIKLNKKHNDIIDDNNRIYVTANKKVSYDCKSKSNGKCCSYVQSPCNGGICKHEDLIDPKEFCFQTNGYFSISNIVVACSPNELLIRYNDSISVGDVIISVPKNNELMCENCNSLARKILSITPSTALGSVNCPISANGCLKLTTRYIKVSEFFAPELLSAFNIENKSEIELEPLFGCVLDISGSIGNNIRSNKNSEQVNMSVDQIAAKEKFEKRFLYSVPNNCNYFSQKDNNKRCVYSNCIVGDNDGIFCLACNYTCDNGCGAKNDWKSEIIPTKIAGIFDFTSPCCIHDKCYSSFFSKSDCDLAFLREMYLSCPVIDLSLLLLPIPLPIRLLTNCNTYALSYYLAVVAFGSDAYSHAQIEQQNYEATPECADKCPSTQTSGGQGTTFLSIDLLKKSGTFPVYYEMYSIPDGLEIFYEGNIIFTTGGLVSYSQTVNVPYSGNSTIIRVKLSAPLDGTVWELKVGCSQ